MTLRAFVWLQDLSVRPVKTILLGALLIIAAFLALLFGAVASSIASDVAGCAS